MNKTDLIQKIKQLEGISQDERAYLINLVNTKKKYGLVWEDKPEDVEEQLRTQLPVLREVVEKRIIAASPDPKGGEPEKAVQKLQQSLFEPENIEQSDSSSLPFGEGRGGASPNHILIEGDNLHALTALTFTHEGKIDVIYIDPPYNTGKKDFKYNDSFVDKEDSYRHSKWLSFMDKRLRIAKRLLSDKGVIFISIDDNEQAQLKLLCDEVFGETNEIAMFIHKNNSNKNQAKLVGVSTEYMVCYVKDKIEFRGIEWKVNKSGAKDIVLAFNRLMKLGLPLEEIEFEIKQLYKRPKYAHLSRWNKVDLNGVFVDADLSREGGPRDYTIINPNTNEPCLIPNRGWGKSYDELIRLQGENLIWYGDENTPPRHIQYIEIEELTVPDSFLYFDNSIDTAWQKNVFGKLIFDNPKPLEMIKHIFSFNDKKTYTILDFFAGSGTTLHATMQLNAEDGGTRQCIMLTNNENNICEEVTYERNRRVIQGYKNSKGELMAGLSNNNFRYYKSEFVGREPSLKNKRELTRIATELLCIKENCYPEKTLDFVFTNKSDSKNIRFFEENDKRMLVVYDDSGIETSVEMIKSIIANNQVAKDGIKVYVFSPGQYPFTEEFEEVLPYITLCALPDAIYKAFLNVLPKKKRQTIPELDEDSIDSQPELFD